MDKSSKERISKEVARSFPEMKGVRPTVKPQGTRGNGQLYLLVYKGQAELPGGRTMKRIVRVVADENGSIIRISTSR